MGVPKVPLVDGDPHFLELLELELGDFDVEIEQAVLGGDDLKRIEDSRPDVVVSDIQMPGMSGAELQQHARRLPGCAEPQFLFVTGRLRRFDDGGRGQSLLPKLAACQAHAERVDSLAKVALADLDRAKATADAQARRQRAGGIRPHLVDAAERSVKWVVRYNRCPVATRLFDVALTGSGAY